VEGGEERRVEVREEENGEWREEGSEGGGSE